MNIETPESPSPSRTPEQMAAVKKARELSLLIINSHPEIAQLFRYGTTYRQIALQYDFDRKYCVGIRIATESVRQAISHLIPDDERTIIAQCHLAASRLSTLVNRKGIHAMSTEQRSELGKRNGIQSYLNKVGIHAQSHEDLVQHGKYLKENKLGIFAMSKEQKEEIGRRAGLRLKKEGRGIHAQSYEDHVRHGKYLKENKLGIFAMSKEQKEEIGRRAGLRLKQMNKGIFALTKEETIAAAKKATLSRGDMPWDTLIDPESGLNEGEFCDRLINTIGVKFLHKNRDLIAQLLNNLFHNGKPVRSENSIYHRLKKLKRSLAA